MRLFLTVVSSCWVIAFTGCASRVSPLDARARAANADYNPQLLIHRFSGFGEVIKFLAVHEGLPHDERSLFEIAADSELQRSFPPEIGALAVVRLDYRGESKFGIRGAQGQGRYYAFRVADGFWQLVGIFHGSSLRWEFVGGTIRVFPHWHTSAFDDPVDDLAFIWNGRFFEYEKQPNLCATALSPMPQGSIWDEVNHFAAPGRPVSELIHRFGQPTRTEQKGDFLVYYWPSPIPRDRSGWFVYSKNGKVVNLPHDEE